MEKPQPKKDWVITPGAFNRFLEWLDSGVNSSGDNYLKIRSRLVSYFDRKNCRLPDELADETLNRVARRLEEEGEIDVETPMKFCYITAKFVFLESLRSKERKITALDEGVENRLGTNDKVGEIDHEAMFVCLEKCAEKLEDKSREIIYGYYQGEERIKIENRRRLAQKFQLSVNALSIRASRIREKLRVCVKECACESDY